MSTGDPLQMPAPLAMSDVVGLLGVAAYVAAYFVVQVLRHPPAGRLPVVLNLIGPVMLLISLSQSFNLPSAVAQGLWLLLTLAGWWRRRRG